MTRYVIGAALLVTAFIHWLPVYGVVGPDALHTLYGIDFASAELQLLMRHRAVMFAIVAALCTVAAFMPRLQLTALLAGWASVLSFLLLAWDIGGYNAALERVVRADLVALACLLLASVALALRERRVSP